MKGPRLPAESEKDALSQQCLEMLLRDGLIHDRDAELVPLTDGVSSEIYRVQDNDEIFIVKRALPKLKVKDNWRADICRNRYEQLFIAYVGRFLPDAMPIVKPGPIDRGYFAMEYLGPGFTNWKQLLLRENLSIAHATQAGTILGQIHARSAGDSEAKRLFDTSSNFTELRIDPYLVTTGNRHPDLSSLFASEAHRLLSTRQCLVHGDFSPKNIMISDQRMVLLDCEVAWYGAPEFDVSFLLTHLLLKALYHAPKPTDLKTMCCAFWHRYTEETQNVFDQEPLEFRATRLLLMLLLARIDGKSPAEYLALPTQANLIRRFVRTHLLAEQFTLLDILKDWFNELHTVETQ